jgi:hypothetical protein
VAGLNHPSTVTNQAHCWASFVTTVGLDYQRATFGWKCADLDAAGLAATVAASTMTLGGMLKHLALVEDQWFSWFLHGLQPAAPWNTVDWDADPDWDWATIPKSLIRKNSPRPLERGRDNGSCHGAGDHGSPEQRVEWFRTGFDGGIEACPGQR